MKDYNLSKRSFVIGGVAALIVVIYILRLFQLQITSDDYKPQPSMERHTAARASRPSP